MYHRSKGVSAKIIKLVQEKIGIKLDELEFVKTPKAKMKKKKGRERGGEGKINWTSLKS